LGPLSHRGCGCAPAEDSEVKKRDMKKWGAEAREALRVAAANPLGLMPAKAMESLTDCSKYELSRMRAEGKGPAWVRLGRKMILYRLDDVLDWVNLTTHVRHIDMAAGKYDTATDQIRFVGESPVCRERFLEDPPFDKMENSDD
jgi:hypothetical protein